MGRTIDAIRSRAGWSLPILVLLGLLLLSLLAIGAADKLRARAERLEQADHDASSLALLVDQHVARAFEGIDNGLARVTDHLDGRRWDQIEHSRPFWQFALKVTRDLPLLHSIELYDQDGRLRVSSGQFPTPALGMVQFDEARFRERLVRSPDALLVAGPAEGLHSDRWYMSVGRAIFAEGGELRGFVVGSVEPQAIRDFFRWAPIGTHGVIELVYEDGTTVASTRPDDRVAGQRSSGAGLIDLVRRGQGGRVLHDDALGDGVERIVAVRPMTNLPFVVLVELTRTDVLKDWLHRFVFDFGVGVAVMIAFTILVCLLYRRIAGEQRATIAAQLAEQRLNDAVESIGESFALWNADDRLVICNSQYRKYHATPNLVIEPGVRFDDVANAVASAGLFRMECDLDAWVAERIERHRNPKGSFEQQLAGGGWMLVIERRTSEGGIVGIRTDITALKEKESELERLVSEIEEARARTEAQAAELARLAEKYAEAHRLAAQANASKTMFLASMSHELRTPLNAILGFSEMMMRETFGPLGNAKYQEYAADVHRSGEHLLELISDVLDLSKIEAGKLELALERQNLAELVGECARLVSDRAALKGITLSVRLPRGLPCARADRRAAKQILLNLLSNAVKFTEAGGLVEVTGAAADGRVTIAVRDTGIGIAPPDLERLFRPFVRAPNAASREGTGLGLAIAQTLAERNGGALRLESKVGEGTVVWLELPVDGEGEPIADAA